MKRLIGYTAALCLLAFTVGCGGVTSTGTLAYISNSTGTGFTVYTVNTDGTLTTVQHFTTELPRRHPRCSSFPPTANGPTFWTMPAITSTPTPAPATARLRL